MSDKEFTGVRLFLNIPAEVAHDPRFKSDKSILLFGEIYSMLNVTGSFFMSNKEMAKRLRSSERTIQRCLDELEKLNYIKREKIVDPKTDKIVGRGKILSTYFPKNIGGDTDDIEGVTQKSQGDDTDDTIIKQNKRASNNNDQSTKVDRQNKSELEENFNKLWKLYPRKEGKKKAFEAYKRAIKKGTTNKEIQTGIVNYLTQIKVQGTDKKYIKQGSTWFNGECWDDDYNLGESQAPVNPKEKTGDAPRPRSREEEELEARKQSAEAFLYNLREHPEYFEIEHMKAAINDFVTKNPQFQEEVLEIARTRGKSDRNTA